MDIIKELAELQDKIYKECGDLYEAIEVLGKPLYDEMLRNYSDTYKKLYEILSLKFGGEYAYAKYFYTLKKELQTPKQRGFLWLFKNEPKKLAIREAKAEMRSQFDLRWEAIEALEATLQAADEAAPAEVFEQPEPPADVQNAPEPPKLADVAPPSEPSTAAHGACDATHQSDEKPEKPAADVAEPPAAAPTSEEPKPKAKPKAKPKNVAKPTAEPSAPTPSTAPAPQLSGQIGIEELAGNK